MEKFPNPFEHPSFEQPPEPETEIKEETKEESKEIPVIAKECLEQERKVLSKETVEAVEGEPDRKKRFRMGKELTAIALSSLIAFSTVQKLWAETLEERQVSKEPKREFVISAEEIASLEKKYQENFQKFKEIIEKENTREKVASLKKRFGGAIDQFLQIHRIEQDLDFLDSAMSKKDKPNFFIDSKDPLVASFGSIISRNYEARWAKKEKRELEGFEIQGLEHVADFSKEELREMIYKTYSKSFLESSMAGVVYISEVKRETKEIFTLGYVESFGIGRMIQPDVRPMIRIYNVPEGMTKERFMSTFFHEVNHPNDWNNSLILTSDERVNMFLDVADRFSQEDRFRSPYVEEIDKEMLALYFRDRLPGDASIEQMVDYVKVSEYWAELGREYVRNPDNLAQNHPQDYELTKKWMERLSKRE